MRSFGALRADCNCKMQNAECKIIGATPIIFSFRKAKHIAYEVYIASSDISHRRYIAPEGYKGEFSCGWYFVG